MSAKESSKEKAPAAPVLERKLKNVALIGYGYWGEKLARVLKEMGVLYGISDIQAARVGKAKADGYPAAMMEERWEGRPDAVVIATPPQTHYELTKRYLMQGLPVFCEKPLGISGAEAVELETFAREQGVRLQTGFIYLYNNGLMAIPRPIGACELYVRILNVGGAPSLSTRGLRFGTFPHALSVAVHFIPDYPVEIKKRAWADGSRLQVELRYSNGSVAFLDVADNTGIRERSVEIRVGGTRWSFSADAPNEYTISSGVGGMDKELDKVEPLKAELEDFLTGVILPRRIGQEVGWLDRAINEIKMGEPE
jgi:predicted dehydrogenase